MERFPYLQQLDLDESNLGHRISLPPHSQQTHTDSPRPSPRWGPLTSTSPSPGQYTESRSRVTRLNGRFRAILTRKGRSGSRGGTDSRRESPSPGFSTRSLWGCGVAFRPSGGFRSIRCDATHRMFLRQARFQRKWIAPLILCASAALREIQLPSNGFSAG